MNVLGRRYQGVTAFVGMPGSGKTYALAQKAKAAMERGIPVYCNAGFDVKGAEVFASFEEFASLLISPGAKVFVWDELPIYTNARKWSEFPDGVFYVLTQVRKFRTELYYSAIDEAMVDVNVRRLTFWYWHCRAITSRVLRRSLYPPEGFRKASQRPYANEFVFVRDEVAALYDTLGTVAIAPSAIAKMKGGKHERWVPVPLGAVAGKTGEADDPQDSAAGRGGRRRGPRLRGGAGATGEPSEVADPGESVGADAR